MAGGLEQMAIGERRKQAKGESVEEGVDGEREGEGWGRETSGRLPIEERVCEKGREVKEGRDTDGVAKGGNVACMNGEEVRRHVGGRGAEKGTWGAEAEWGGRSSLFPEFLAGKVPQNL